MANKKSRRRPAAPSPPPAAAARAVPASVPARPTSVEPVRDRYVALLDLVAAREARQAAEVAYVERVAALVVLLRGQGVSWARIGEPLGITGEAVRRRFGGHGG